LGLTLVDDVFYVGRSWADEPSFIDTSGVFHFLGKIVGTPVACP
jgi:hypothetical protein